MADLGEQSLSPVSIEEETSAELKTNEKKSSKPSKQNKIKKSQTKPSHPPTSELVMNAIKTLKDRQGSSLQAIKKHIASNYSLDTEKLAPFIKKYLKNATASGKLIQTKGKGASGSFKLPTDLPKPIKKSTKSEKKEKSATIKSKSIKKSKVKSTATKQKATKPSIAASKLKAPKPKKASSSKKAASTGGGKKSKSK